jgi:hypothetical protein
MTTPILIGSFPDPISSYAKVRATECTVTGNGEPVYPFGALVSGVTFLKFTTGKSNGFSFILTLIMREEIPVAIPGFLTKKPIQLIYLEHLRKGEISQLGLYLSAVT